MRNIMWAIAKSPKEWSGIGRTESEKRPALYCRAKALYGCGTYLLEQIGNRGKCSESVPDGVAEEVQQREPGKEAFSCMTSVDEPMFGYMGNSISRFTVRVHKCGSCTLVILATTTVSGWSSCRQGWSALYHRREKDVMSLAAHGFHAICFNSETAFIPAAVIHRLSFRFKHIILLYDVDSTGLKSSAKREEELKEYGVKRLLLPLAGTKTKKDVSDYFMLGTAVRIW